MCSSDLEYEGPKEPISAFAFLQKIGIQKAVCPHSQGLGEQGQTGKNEGLLVEDNGCAGALRFVDGFENLGDHIRLLW